MPMKLSFVISVLINLLLISGCAYDAKFSELKKPKDFQEYEKYQDFTDSHILRINRDGAVINSNIATQPLMDRQQSKPWEVDKVAEQADKMLIGALKLACLKAKKDCHDLQQIKSINNIDKSLLDKSIGEQEVNLLMFIHGGLNSYSSTDDRMNKVADIMEGRFVQENNQTKNIDWHYPIFVSWPSNFLGTYSDHAVNIREGRETSTLGAILSAPFVLAEDLMRMIAEFPSTVYFQAHNDKERWCSGLPFCPMSNIWEEASDKYGSVFGYKDDIKISQYYQDQKGNVTANRSIYCSNAWTKTTTTYVLATAPIRYIAGSIYNGAFASNSWDMMKRRAMNIAHPAGIFDKNARQDGEYGDIGVLLEKITYLEKTHGYLNVNLTLVGHSMGTIVLNNLLSRYQRYFEETNWLSNIVYMAAAANIEDTLAIVPNILRNNTNTINFYNLTLNRVSEVAEINLWGLFAGSGSLLVSIDKYHDEPEHYLRRTMGSEVNIQSSLDVVLNAFGGMEDEVTLKAFNSTSNSKPQKHGDFGHQAFWEKRFWEIPVVETGMLANEQINCN